LTRQDGEIVGVLTLVDKRSGPFDEDDSMLATGVGAYIAELAVTAGLPPWLAQGVRVVPRPALASAGDDAPAKAAILSRILAIALKSWPPTAAGFCLRPDDGRATRHSRRDWASANCIGAHDGIAGATFRPASSPTFRPPTRTHASIPRSTGRSAIAHTQHPCAPIFSADGQRLGVLQVVNKQHGSFDAADESHLRSLASQMGVTLDYTCSCSTKCCDEVAQ
jgi:adenylate cyclase